MIKVSIGLLLAYSFSFALNPECSHFYSQRRGLERIVSQLTPIDQNLNIIPVKYVLPVLNQGSRGFCWLYSAYESLVNRSILRTGINPEVSIFYLSYYHWLESAIASSVNLKSSQVNEGGYVGTAMELIKKVGVVTDQQWKEIGGSTTINLPSQSAKEDPQVRALMQKSHLDKQLLVDWLKPNVNVGADASAFKKYYDDLYGSENFLYLMETLLQQKTKLIRSGGPTAFDLKTIAMIRKAIQERSAPPYKMSIDDINSLIERIDKDITDDMTRLFNRIYFDRDTNPIDVKINREHARARAQELFPELGRPVVYFISNNNRKHETKVSFKNETSREISISAEKLKKIVSAFHQANHPVIMVYDHQRDFVQMDKGLLSTKDIRHWPINPYINRRARQYDNSVNYSSGMHLALSIGTYTYKKEKDKIAGFLIRNSWGEKSGRNGDLIMDESFFGSFISNVSVFAEDLKSPQVRKLLGPDILEKLELD